MASAKTADSGAQRIASSLASPKVGGCAILSGGHVFICKENHDGQGQQQPAERQEVEEAEAGQEEAGREQHEEVTMAKKRPRGKTSKAAAAPPSCTFEQLQALGVLPLMVGGHQIGEIEPRRFATGSYGLGLNGPATIALPDGSVAEFQCSVNLVVKNSKHG